MDFNADGYADVVVAHTALYRGSASGLVADPGPKRPVMFSTIEIVGDVNNDNIADVVVGDGNCPQFSRDMPACGKGTISIYFGSPTGLAAKPAQVITAATADTHFGMQVIPLGDIDGDKLADIAVPDVNGVHIYRGTKTGFAPPIDLPNGTAMPVGTVVAAGDIDRDGKADFLMITGATAALWYGGAKLDRTLEIPLGGDAQFYGAAGAGDFDGDGFGDLALVVEPSSPTGNLVANDLVIYRGSAKGLVLTKKVRFSHDAVRAEFGGEIASVGDLDGDKRDDLVVLATCSKFDAKNSACLGGMAYVYLGGAKGLAPRPVAQLAANFVSAGGDIDKDGHPDLVISVAGPSGNVPALVRGGKGGVFVAPPKK